MYFWLGFLMTNCKTEVYFLVTVRFMLREELINRHGFVE